MPIRCQLSVGISSRPIFAQQREAPLKIGLLDDFSSVCSHIGGVMDLEGAKMAIEDFGGVMFGKPIELVSADPQHGSVSCRVLPAGRAVFGIRQYVEQVNGFSLRYGPSGKGVPVHRQRVLGNVLNRFGRIPAVRDHSIRITDPLVDAPSVRSAKPRGGLRQRVEYRLQVECRAVDNLEHVGSSRLPF
jgi:hypothetical protein